MRGKRGDEQEFVVVRGITPAHAGKTAAANFIAKAQEDHPRACGENLFGQHAGGIREGSPPRMRGKRTESGLEVVRQRITPAHAGKTEP